MTPPRGVRQSGGGAHVEVVVNEGAHHRAADAPEEDHAAERSPPGIRVRLDGVVPWKAVLGACAALITGGGGGALLHASMGDRAGEAVRALGQQHDDRFRQLEKRSADHEEALRARQRWEGTVDAKLDGITALLKRRQ